MTRYKVKSGTLIRYKVNGTPTKKQPTKETTTRDISINNYDI